MIDVNRHKFLLVQILKDVYSDFDLASSLGFKGGTALMLFYDLPRFSVDLDFNLLVDEKSDLVYSRMRKILLKYGTIHDEAKKFDGPLLVLDYGFGERKLKVEISNRNFNDRYSVMNFLGINVRVMVPEDMFTHKLCALLDRTTVTPRDIFDCWFFAQKRTSLNGKIIESRMGMPLSDYLQQCINQIEAFRDKKLLDGLGELMNPEMKNFVRTKMRSDLIQLLNTYKAFPI